MSDDMVISRFGRRVLSFWRIFKVIENGANTFPEQGDVLWGLYGCGGANRTRPPPPSIFGPIFQVSDDMVISWFGRRVLPLWRIFKVLENGANTFPVHGEVL